jgi:Uma2 family endonuclease
MPMPATLAPPVVRSAPPQRLRLDAAANGIVMGPQEFDAIDDWNRELTFELIHGVVIVSPIPREGEVGPNEYLGMWLINYREGHSEGGVLDGTLPERYVYLSDGSRRRADRVLWIGLGRRPNPKVDVPAIVVEFVSQSRRDWLRDFVEKRTEYAAAGVREYWVIDRFRRLMTVFRGLEELSVAEAATYTTPLLPGFELPLAKLLAIADEWSRDD